MGTQQVISISDKLYVAGAFLLLVFLPWWNLGMSIAGFWLIGAWLIKCLAIGFSHSTFSQYWNKKHLWVLLLFVGFYTYQGIGLLWTEEISFGLRDLRIKLPLLFLPIVLTFFPKLNSKSWKILWASFAFSVFTVSLVIAFRYSFLMDNLNLDPREAFISQSHIRYGQMLALVTGGLLAQALWKKHFWPLLPAIWLTLFAVYMQMGTALVSLLLVSILLLIFLAKKRKSMIKWVLPLFAAILLCSAGYIYWQASSFFQLRDTLVMETTTPDGEQYQHMPQHQQIENGYYVMRHIAWGEMAAAWKKRSEKDFEAASGALIRYLSSKGLKKDREGVEQLEEFEIAAIEKGVTNPILLSGNPLDKRLYTIFNQINMYESSGNPSGYSLVQRYHYQKMALKLIGEAPLFGHGIGDSQQAFDAGYEKWNSQLAPEWRLRSHNQYLSIAVSVGLVGLLLLLALMVVPVFGYDRKHNVLFLIFLLVIAAGFLTEDTLETQAGATLFAYLFILLSYFPEANIFSNKSDLTA